MYRKSNLPDVFGLFAVIAFVALFLVAIFGWVFNIVEIANTVNLPISGMFILRCIGIFVAPLGAILGYL